METSLIFKLHAVGLPYHSLVYQESTHRVRADVGKHSDTRQSSDEGPTMAALEEMLPVLANSNGQLDRIKTPSETHGNPLHVSVREFPVSSS